MVHRHGDEAATGQALHDIGVHGAYALVTVRKDHHGKRGFVSRHRDRGQGVGNRALEKS